MKSTPFLMNIFPNDSQRIKQENEVLKSYLKAAQDDVATLLDEKRTLMDTIRSLQVSFIHAMMLEYLIKAPMVHRLN